MLNNHKISLVMPCKNEKDSLKYLLQKIPAFIDEIIIVNNNSTDNTVEVAKSFPKSIVLNEKRHQNGIGYGYAYKKGISNSSGDIIVCLDADCSYPITKINSIISHLTRKELDFISCNRLIPKNLRDMSIVRVFGIMILNNAFRVLFKYPIKDLLSGMWVFRKTVIPDLNLDEGGWNFSIAIKLSAILSKSIKFTEIPIKYQDRLIGKSKQSIFITGFEHLLYLITQRTKLINTNFTTKPAKKYETV